jgi:hypothetical protein
MFFSEQRGLYALRQAWADVANWHLEQAGVPVRITPKNLREQGLERDPERRVAPYHSTQAKYQGRATPEWQEILRARAERRTEHDPAAALWEVRKAHLGITQGVTRDVFLHRVAEQARGGGYTKSHEPLDTLREHEQVLAQAVQRQELYIHRLHAEVMQEAYRERTGRPRSARAEARINALLREGPEPRLDAPLIGNQQSHRYHEPGQPQYGEVHPNHQVLFWSHAEALVAGFRRAATRDDGLGAPGYGEADHGGTSGRVTGRILDKYRIGEREFALIERRDGEQALLPWQAGMTQQRGQVVTLQHATGQLWHVVSLDDHVPSRGAAFRFRDRDRGMDVGF